MNFFRAHLQLVLRLALIAVLALALAPTLSRLLVPATGSGPWSEICSTAGARWLTTAVPSSGTDPAAAPASPVPASPEPTRMAHMEHCPLCAQFSPVLGPPPSQAAAVQVPDGAHYLPVLYTQAPHTLYAWAPAQARAPPLS